MVTFSMFINIKKKENNTLYELKTKRTEEPLEVSIIKTQAKQPQIHLLSVVLEDGYSVILYKFL